MKYYTFYREDDKFDDILKDIILKKLIDQKIRWYQHLMLGMIADDRTTSYITLKYGDEMVNGVVKDFSPIPGIDYTPKRNNI
jgi:hypothetical protein